MRFDIILYSDLSADDMVRYGKLAEEYGLGGVWIANNTDTRDAFVNFVPLRDADRTVAHGSDRRQWL